MATSLLNNVSGQVRGRVFGPNQTDPANLLSRIADSARRGDLEKFSLVQANKDILGNAKSRGDPLMSFNWYADFPVLANGAKLGYEFAEEATTPFVEFEQLSNYRAGKNIHYPGHYSLGTLSFRLYENSRGTSITYLQSWQAEVHDTETGSYGNPRDYKKTIVISILDVAKKQVILMTYKGCWPMRTDAYSLVSDSSDRLHPTVEFSVDSLIVQIADIPPSAFNQVLDRIKDNFPVSLQFLPNIIPESFNPVRLF